MEHPAIVPPPNPVRTGTPKLRSANPGARKGA
jgi:hypothetical protein